MKKLKERLKRGLAMMMAAASIVSVFPSMNVSAASETAKITFAYCHDGAGNTIKYQQTVTHDGRVCGEAGDARTRIYADGEPAFCIQPGVSLHTGNTLRANASDTWNALSGSQRDAVNLALLYGSQGSMGSLPGSEDEKVVATQMVIWEIVTGCRNANAPYNQTDSKFYNSICANGANGGVSAAYSQIVAGMQEHGTIPSFASTSRGAVVKELSWNGDKYVLNLTDTNGVLSQYHFTSSDSSVSVSASGNTLTISSAKAVTDEVVLTATKRSPAVSGTLVAYGDASLQDVVVGVESAADITVYLSVKIPYGHVQIVKTSEDGIVEGLRFQITGNGIDKTVVTGKNGKIKVENLNPGTYTVTELTEERYEPQKSQKVTVSGGQTAKVEFSNILKRGDLKVIKGSEDNLVEGMRFHLYGTSLSGATVDEYAVTDKNGVAMFSNILISSSTPYTLEEVDTAVRYVIPEKQNVTIKWKEVTSATMTNILKKFRVNVTKTDRENGEPQGDATLAGAVYGIYEGDTLIDTYTTDSEGKFTTKYYICGDNWNIREITPSEGYLLDETVHHVGAEAKNYTVELNTTSNDVNEQVIKGRISIIKHTDDGSTQIETPEEGAEFQVYLKRSGSYDNAKESESDTLVCDEYGYAETKDLPYGVYTVHQTKGWEGSELMKDFDVYVSKDGEIYRYLINNRPFADPDMEFVFDHGEKTLNARTFQQDNLNRFDEVVTDGVVDEALENELNDFASQWFKNIREQGYLPIKEEKQLTESDVPIGTELMVDGRRFSVDSVDIAHGSASLKDLTFQSGTGFPVFRSEPIQLVYDLIQGQKDTAQKESGVQVDTPEKEGSEQADLAPAWEKKKPTGRIRGFDLHPEIPQEQRSQYRITNDELGHGMPKEKFRANIAAVQLLKKCEDEDRYATPEEQEILAKYVGWGGLADAFDETKSAWGYEYLELKTVLTPEEYAAARQSTLTAFYTPPVVIRAMYQALENMGLKSGNILEPSCAVGNFMGMKPESLSDCKIYGVEVDSISGRIAGQLYQKSTVAVQGYEEAELPDSFFDVAIGNVPFGQFKLSDRRYDRNNFLVHDYFFAKTLDKVRPGGVIAFITSSGTMDKKNPAIRRYIAQRAELLGAIRLPNDTFKKNAGTEVTSDILFLQKRDRMVEAEPDWLYLDADENGITQNRYFVEHPEMVLGEMVMESTQYGMDSTCRPYENMSLESLLAEAVENIQAEIAEHETDELVEEEDNSIPADPSVANFSFTVYDGKIYYRENSRMKPVELSVTAANRVKGMVAIRDCVRELIAYQTEGYADTVIEGQQRKLNQLYDTFQKKYGILNARANSMVFSDDNSYPLLCSLEVVAEDGVHARKADMFHKRTIKPHQAVTKVDTASEALSLSLSEKARVDMDYMCSLTGKSAEEIERELSGVIFRLPNVSGGEPEFVSEDEYLSGNVREKLKEAKLAVATSEVYKVNVEALEKVQPKDLTASEISVRLGATWIPISDVSEFMFQLLDTPNYNRWNIKIHFSKFTGEWNIEGKSNDKGNPKANNAYGTHRVNAYKIIEDTLNLRDTRVYDYIPTEDGKKKAVLNKEETAIAQGKQDLIKQAFQDWIWQNPERRQRLTAYYNENFNAIRPREYDGSHLNFYGMNPEIQLRQHQKNGAARIIYGGNSLLAYVVGAGKTYTMVAAAMECKRLGLCNKSMIVVPNHIIEQFAAEWLQLYPAANLLVATKKDFETKNRKKFCARIATSDIDAVIIGHSQFEKIPLSLERQQRMLEEQIEEIIDGIAEAKHNGGSRFTIKQMEKSKKSLQAKLSKLNDQSRKDDVVFFEELGIDRLFVDEADGYKNLYLYTKMRNVGGIAQTEAQKSSDMFMKCRYLDGLTGGKGVIFATGTPVSNSMVELYTMQRYLQYNTLVRNHLQHFDAWASTFGETVSAIELAPEGSGYRMKTRFARFYNLPELMMMFREVADIQTADMLNLPVPEAEYKVVAVKPSEIQKDMVQTLGERAERVRNGMVNPMQDNMLLITNDGRKLALDQRLTNEMLPDEPESKVNACVNEVYRFWEEGKEQKLTQLLFCDLSTPKNDGTFSVYNDVRDKLVAKGIPPQEIEFIHDANTEVRKKELFSKVRRGAVRILMGSTFKMGAGTNVQNLIIASHDLDCPWRPRDLEQRGGRTIRQGNQNKKVFIVRYVTEGTFDAYMYQMIENKQKFISQIMTSKSPARTIEDIDEVALSYAEIKALATGNPYIKEKMDLDIQVSKLQLLKQSFLSQRYEMEDKVTKYYPMEIKRQSQWIVEYQQDIEQVKEHTPPDRDMFPPMQINGVTYGEKKEAGQAIIAACKAMTSPDPVPLGAYRGLTMELSYSTFSKEFVITLQGKRAYHVTLGTDIHGNITRLDNEIEKFGDNLSRCEERLETLKAQLENAKIEAVKEFPKEQELAEKTARLGELNALLDMDKKENIVLDCEPEEEETEPEKGNKDRER